MSIFFPIMRDDESVEGLSNSSKAFLIDRSSCHVGLFCGVVYAGFQGPLCTDSGALHELMNPLF